MTTWPIPPPRTCHNCGATYVGAHDCNPAKLVAVVGPSPREEISRLMQALAWERGYIRGRLDELQGLERDDNANPYEGGSSSGGEQ
jgi:hypothetical protein